MNKQAYEHIVGACLSKRGSWIEEFTQWIKDKAEDPTGDRSRSRAMRKAQLQAMQQDPRYTAKENTFNYNFAMRNMYDDATRARGNKPYIRSRDGKYEPAPGHKYK